MHPMQLSSFAVNMANQPSRLGALRQANTSTGHTARQKPHALHMSSEMMTSHFPAGPRDAFLSALNSGISGSAPRRHQCSAWAMAASAIFSEVTMGLRALRISLTENTTGPGRGQVLKRCSLPLGPSCATMPTAGDARMKRALYVAALVLSLAIGLAAAQTSLSDTDSGLRLEWDARTAQGGGTLISGYIYNDNRRPAIKVRLLAEALDGTGQVIDRSIGFVVGAVPVSGRSYWTVPLKVTGARYRVTIAFFELKEGSS